MTHPHARPTGALTASIRALFGAAAAITLAFGMAAAAPNQIRYSNGIDPPVIVNDADLADMDGDPDEISVNFHLVDANGDWVADGWIHATTTDPNGATLVVTDTEIVNVTGSPILGAIIDVHHTFDPLVSFTQKYVAHTDGEFDKNGPGPLGNLILNNVATITGATLVGNFNFMASFDDPPKTFSQTSLPVHLDTVTEQNEIFSFYIDEIDNLIRLESSATILPVNPNAVPATATGPMLALAFAVLSVACLAIVRRRGGEAARG